MLHVCYSGVDTQMRWHHSSQSVYQHWQSHSCSAFRYLVVLPGVTAILLDCIVNFCKHQPANCDFMLSVCLSLASLCDILYMYVCTCTCRKCFTETSLPNMLSVKLKTEINHRLRRSWTLYSFVIGILW